MNDELHTHYKNLSVMETAPIEIITASFTALMNKYSTEAYGADAEAARIRSVLTKSYEVLSSPSSRRAHDAWIQVRRVESASSNDRSAPLLTATEESTASAGFISTTTGGSLNGTTNVGASISTANSGERFVRWAIWLFMISIGVWTLRSCTETHVTPNETTGAASRKPFETTGPAEIKAVPSHQQGGKVKSRSPTATCPTVNDCLSATLVAMARGEIETVKAIAKRIDTFPKPMTGNSAAARRLNAEGLQFFKNDDFTKAADFFHRARLEDPSDVEVAANLGYARVKEGDFERARQSLRAALLLSPRRVSTWLPIAELAARQSNNTVESVSALLVAYVWSAREKAIDYYRAQATSERDPQLRTAYKQALEIALQISIASTARLELGLVNALRIDANSLTRLGDSGSAIQEYMGEGYVGMRPNNRTNNTDYYLLKKPAKFLGHDLFLIEEEYASPSLVGCCVNPGAGVTVKVNGDARNLQEFAIRNRCAIVEDINLQQKLLTIGIQSGVPSGQFATLSCRES